MLFPSESMTPNSRVPHVWSTTEVSFRQSSDTPEPVVAPACVTSPDPRPRPLPGRAAACARPARIGKVVSLATTPLTKIGLAAWLRAMRDQAFIPGVDSRKMDGAVWRFQMVQGETLSPD